MPASVFEIERCLSPKEVADLLGVSERTALRLMSSGKVLSFRIGKLWRTTPAKVADFKAASFDRYRLEVA